MSVVVPQDTITSELAAVKRRLRTLETPGPSSNSTNVTAAANNSAGAASAVSAAAGANNGGSPPAPTASGSGVGCSVSVGSGTTPAAGAQVTISFSPALPSVPTSVVLTPRNSATAALSGYVSSAGAGSVTISTVNAPAASQSAGYMQWYVSITLI